MLTITIKIKKKEVLPRLFDMLNTFSKDEIQVEDNNIQNIKSKNVKKHKFTDEYIKKNWRKIAYTASGNIDKDDDELLPEAYWEYKND